MVNNWDYSLIGDIFDFKNGLNKGKEFFGCGTPIVNYTDVYKKRALIKADIKGKVSLDADEIRRFEAKKYDVFFTRTSETPEEVGMSSVLLEDVEGCVFSGFVLRARPKNNMLHPQYCKYCFSTPEIRSAIILGCTYTTRALTNGKQLSTISIPVPPLSEQERIAEALSDVDSMISSLEKLIAKKKAVKQGAMQELLTGKKRLPGFTEEWECHRLGEYVDCIRGVSYNGSNDVFVSESNQTIRLLRSNNIQGAKFDLNDVQYIRRDIVRDNQMLKEFDIMICMANGSRQLVGKNCIFTEALNERYTFGAFMSCLRATKSDTNMNYIFELLNSTQYWNNIALLLSGSSINNLRPNDILEMEFEIPSIAEQTAIASILSDMDNEIEALEQKLAKTRQLKQGMMQQLLTGKIRLV